MTLKIMNSVIHAPPRCEPKNRDRRPRSFGALRSRITTKVTMPKNAIIAMKSCRKPSTAQWPTIGIAQSSPSAPEQREQRAVRLEVDRGQDQERPEHEEVRGARARDHLSSFFWPKTSTTWRFSGGAERGR